MKNFNISLINLIFFIIGFLSVCLILFTIIKSYYNVCELYINEKPLNHNITNSYKYLAIDTQKSFFNLTNYQSETNLFYINLNTKKIIKDNINIVYIYLVLLLILFFLFNFYNFKITSFLNKLIYDFSLFNKKIFVKQSILNSGIFSEELNRLSLEINNFFENILTELSSKEDKLNFFNHIFEIIPSGIIILSKKGHILLFNREANKIFNNRLEKDKYYWEVLIGYNLVELINKILNDNKNLKGELKLNDNYYSYIAESNSNFVLVILKDITQDKLLDIKEKEFISNVSHELKTPISIIKGYIETMYDDLPEEYKNLKYFEIINKNIDRLIALINDILTIFELEEVKDLKNIKKIDLNEIILKIIDFFKNRARSKNLEIIYNKLTDNHYISGDDFKIEQAFINLVDNAIKYTENGSITITIDEDSKNIIFSVKDTGIGIRKQDINKLFNRFFVVDKNESRKKGGTGLGLSIVKKIIDLHNGIIEVKSEYGVGSEFIIYFHKIGETNE